MKATQKQLDARVDSAIERREEFIWGIVQEGGQMLENVRHTRWFKQKVREFLVDNSKKWSHLKKETRE